MSEPKKVDILEVLEMFAERKKMFLTVIVLISILGVLLAFVWPKSYKASLTFIVTNPNSINLSGGGLLSGLANLTSSGSGVSSEQVLVLLRSNEIKDKIIDDFDLQERFGTDIREALRKKVDNRISIEDKREAGLGLNSIIAITINYTESEATQAFEVVNRYYELIDEKALSINKKQIEDAYILLKSRLDQNLLDLKIAEDSLVSFQKRYGILEVEEQAKVQVQNIYLIKAEITKLEIQTGYVKELFGDNSSRYKELRIQLDEFNKTYSELLGGEMMINEANNNPFKSMAELPDLFIEYLRRYREVIVQEEIYKVLFPQFEQQKLQYDRADSGLRIIDPSTKPTYKDSPKRSIIIIVAFFFGIILSSILVIFNSLKERLRYKDAVLFERMSNLRGMLSKW